jgi:hypothetical protein
VARTKIDVENNERQKKIREGTSAGEKSGLRNSEREMTLRPGQNKITLRKSNRAGEQSWNRKGSAHFRPRTEHQVGNFLHEETPERRIQDWSVEENIGRKNRNRLPPLEREREPGRKEIEIWPAPVGSWAEGLGLGRTQREHESSGGPKPSQKKKSNRGRKNSDSATPN